MRQKPGKKRKLPAEATGRGNIDKGDDKTKQLAKVQRF